MTGDDEWLMQLECAEGRFKLGDGRGDEFLSTATLSNNEEILEVAREMIDSPELARMRSVIETEQKCKYAGRVRSAKRQLQNGGRVIRYKVLYMPSVR
jgi:hypothetical protein